MALATPHEAVKDLLQPSAISRRNRMLLFLVRQPLIKFDTTTRSCRRFMTQEQRSGAGWISKWKWPDCACLRRNPEWVLRRSAFWRRRWSVWFALELGTCYSIAGSYIVIQFCTSISCTCYNSRRAKRKIEDYLADCCVVDSKDGYQFKAFTYCHSEERRRLAYAHRRALRLCSRLEAHPLP